MRLLRPLARIWTVLLGCTATALTLGLAARMLLPLSPWVEAPALVEVAPADGAAAVLPRSAIELRFSQPMNRRSTLAALNISPATPGDLLWSDDARTLTFQPRPALSADITYTVSLDAGALDRWWRPLDEPRTVAFRTAPQPAVLAALPEGVAPADTSVAVIFSQPMVRPEQVGTPAELPELRFEPPIAASLRWADPSTLLIRPAAPLRAAARYTATIGADLADLRGVELGRPFSWSFSTAWPAVIAQSPAPGLRWASPRQPLTLSLDAPVELPLLREALAISPPVEGELAAATLGSTQLITFTPRLGWQPGQSYSVSLVAPPGRGLSPPPPLRWRFSVAPPPGLLAFFPGQSQTLPPGQAIRLIFSTPMDEAALRAGLSIDPPVDELPITVSETEVRLRPALRPSTTYTITLAAGTTDRNGEPIAGPASLNIRTGPAAPALRASGAPGGVVTVPVSTTAAVELERVNLDRLDLALYRLDTPSLLRALGSGPAGLRDFQPERYGQALARSWRVDLDDPADAPARDAVPIALADGVPLDPGAYYLRVLSAEGPRSDLILLVSSIHLSMRQSESQVLVWATDLRSGAPLAGVPVALYAGDAPLTRGLTDPDGVWEQPIQRGPQEPPFLAVAEGAQPAIVSGAWASLAAPAEPRSRALLLLDAPAYPPGATARLAGQARRTDAGGALALPAPGTPCRLQLLADGGPRPPAPLAADCRVAADGGVSGSLRLDPRIAPGAYTLRAQVGDAATLLPLRVSGPSGQARLDIVGSGPAALTLQASAADLPLPNTVVSWSLRLEPLDWPAADGYRFPAPGAVEELSGSGSTDNEGRLSLALPTPGPGAPPLRLRLRAALPGPDGIVATAEETTIVAAAVPTVGLRLPLRVVTTDERATVDLLALGPDGRPAAGAALTVEVFRGDEPAGDPLLVRRARSGLDGRASAQLVQLNPGRYSVIARAGDAESRADLWVAGGSYAGWENEPGRVALIPDREAYRPGDTARLLVTAPVAEANLLLSVERGDLLAHDLRGLRAGQLITLTVGPELAPAVGLGALVAAGEERRFGEGILRVISDTLPLSVSVVADRGSYLPGATAALSVTVTEAGAPVPADLVLAIAPDAALPSELSAAAAGLSPGQPVQLAAAVGSASSPRGAGAEPPARLAPPGYLVPIRGGAGGAGVTVAQAQLPEQPGRWRVVAYAFRDAERIAIGSTVISTSLPLELIPRTPPALRPGDTASAELLLRNSSAVTQTLRATLAAAGATLDDGQPASQQVLIAPGGRQLVSWRLRGGPSGPGELAFRVQGDGIDERLTRDVGILPAPEPAAHRGETWAGSGGLSVLAPPAPAGGELELALAPSLRAALAAAATDLAERPARDTDESAALLLIAAGLSREGPPAERESWRELADEAASELAAAQNTDGGWGWWADTPSDLFVSAFVLEAQAAGRTNLGLSAGPNLRGISYVQRAAAAAPAALRAYATYALSRAGRPDSARAAAQIDATLAPDSLAFLSLSLPAAQAGGPLELIPRPAEGAALPWHAADGAPLPRTPLAVSAAVAQALRALQPDAPALAAAEQSLRLAWGVDGWPSAYEAARVAAALLPAGAEPAPPLRLQVDGRPIASGPISETLRLRLPAGPAAEGAAIVVEAPAGSAYLLAARAPAEAAEQPPGRPPLELRLLSPVSGAPADAATLRVGETVAVEMIAICPRPLLRATLVADLPAGLEPLAVEAPAPFARAAVDGPARRVTLDAAGLSAGVYTVRVVARVVAAGEFSAGPPRLLDRLGGEPPVSAREPLLVRAAR